jgi:hypothetical protein
VRVAALVILLGLSGCAGTNLAYTVQDPENQSKTFAKCFSNMTASFCQVQQPAGTAIVSGHTVLERVEQAAAIAGSIAKGVPMIPVP